MTDTTQCSIAGGGPAGIMKGYLLARAGVETVVLEKHEDYLRDFRGDTISNARIGKPTNWKEEGGRIRGVRAAASNEPVEIRAALVVGAGGRHSTVRSAAGLIVCDYGAPDGCAYRDARGIQYCPGSQAHAPPPSISSLRWQALSLPGLLPQA